MNDQMEDDIDPKRLPQRNCLKPLETHYVVIYDVENTNSTNMGKDLRLTDKARYIPRGRERKLQVDQSHRTTIHWSTQPQGEHDEEEKCI